MINGMAPPISAAQYKLRSGDRLDWIYLTSNEQYGVYPPGFLLAVGCFKRRQ